MDIMEHIKEKMKNTHYYTMKRHLGIFFYVDDNTDVPFFFFSAKLGTIYMRPKTTVFPSV